MVNVNTIQSGTVFAWFMLVMIIRRIVLFIVAGVAGYYRPFPPGTRVPEDKILKKVEGDATPTGDTPVEYTKDVRVNKTIGNDTENDTYFLILVLATAVYSDSASGNSTRTIVYGAIYLFARIVFAVAYIMALQPWRTLVYTLGLACTLACSLDLVITLSLASNSNMMTTDFHDAIEL